MTRHAQDAPAQPRPSVDRRSALLLGSGALAGAATLLGVVGPAAAQKDDPHAGHDMHDHHRHGEHGHTDSQHQALIEVALDCVAKGEACVPHCVDLMATGDTSLADCLRSVSAMMPLCSAAARFAALDAPRLKAVAKLCGDICDDCEKVCRKHAEHHQVCKACADSCAAFVKESRKLTDA